MISSPARAQGSRTALILFAYFFALFAASTALRPLFEPDEGRYTAGALQMLERGDWIHPYLNPEQPHFSKPPIVYWPVMLGIKFLGRHEWAVRLANVFSWAGVLLLLAALGRRTMPARALSPALVFASSLYPFLAFSFITPDILLAFWEALAASAFLFARYRPGRRDPKFWLTIAFVALGLGFATKGPPSLLVWLAWLITALVLRDSTARAQGLWVPGMLLALLLAVGWYIVVVLQEHRLLAFFVRGELYQRMFTTAHHRNPAFYTGLAMYGGILVAGFLPLSVPAVVAWWRTGRKGPGAALRRIRQDEPWTLFFLVWLALGLAVFCFTPSRLPLYILPLAMPAAWVLGALIPEGWWSSKWLPRMLVVWGLLVLVGVGAVRHAKISEDARAFANHVQQENLLPADEIVFVGKEPYYGLRFYSGLEVERCELTDPVPLPGAPYETFEPVMKECADDPETRIWAVKTGHVEELKRLLEESGCRVMEASRPYQGYHLLKTTP